MDFSELTNAYGDIPYSEAIAGDETVFTPKYDTQDFIYQDLLQKLDEAKSLLNNSGTILGDVMYNGDATKWIKFANALKLRLLMYASNKIDVTATFRAVVQEDQLFTSNEDQAVLPFLSSFPNQFPTIPLKQGDFDAVAIGKSAVDVMVQFSDPRLSRYARPDNLNFDAPTFTGVANGVGGQTGSRLGLAYFDYPGQIKASDLGIDYANGILMSYAEVEFLLAEATAKGWLSGDVETHYKKGIQASHTYYQVNYDPFGWNDFEDFYFNSGCNIPHPWTFGSKSG